MGSYKTNSYIKYDFLLENKTIGQRFDLLNFITYNSNCSWFKIIVGPCDNTNNEDPIVKSYDYGYKPFGNWKDITLFIDHS